MATLIRVLCSACEGAKQVLNAFHPRLDLERLERMGIVTPNVSPSGRYLTGRECPQCRGLGVVDVPMGRRESCGNR